MTMLFNMSKGPLQMLLGIFKGKKITIYYDYCYGVRTPHSSSSKASGLSAVCSTIVFNNGVYIILNPPAPPFPVVAVGNLKKSSHHSNRHWIMHASSNNSSWS